MKLTTSENSKHGRSAPSYNVQPDEKTDPQLSQTQSMPSSPDDLPDETRGQRFLEAMKSFVREQSLVLLSMVGVPSLAVCVTHIAVGAPMASFPLPFLLITVGAILCQLAISLDPLNALIPSKRELYRQQDRLIRSLKKEKNDLEKAERQLQQECDRKKQRLRYKFEQKEVKNTLVNDRLNQQLLQG